MLKRLAIAAISWLAATHHAAAMTFTWVDSSTVLASGPIEKGDAAKFALLAKFSVLQLASPGGSVYEALRIAANMDARGNIHTVVKPDSSCASACAMAIFVSGKTRVVYAGGRLGIHSCAHPDGTAAPECNEQMAANAFAHGVPWGIIEGFGNQTKPSDMLWLSAEDAECWGLMKWSSEDSSNNGLACWQQAEFKLNKKQPAQVTATNANDVLCRLNAGTSRIAVSADVKGQGFSNEYRKACRRIAADPRTPKYAAIDIILWLTLTDPDVWSLKPGTLVANILAEDTIQLSNCWKCLTIFGMSSGTYGDAKEGLRLFQSAVELAKFEKGSAPRWLTSRVDLAKVELAKENNVSAPPPNARPFRATPPPPPPVLRPTGLEARG